MHKNSSKVIFCDIGGVLLTDGWGHVARQAAAKEFHLDYFSMDILHDFIFNTYEIGKITLDNYLKSSLQILCFRSRLNYQICCNG